ncbi:MAG: TolC family protein [Bryobacterales bacterium]|nr:TolC family protein [Bryobacterales bacterium]
MKTTRQLLALLCVALIQAPFSALSQTYSYMQNKERPWIIRNYVPVNTPPANFSNSGRLESLLRAGNLYLSLQDAIALALENNLDIELQRYGPQQAEANLLRTQAGGLLRGVSTSVQQGPASAVSQATGGIGGGTGGGSGTAGGGDLGTTAGGTVITQTGATIINLDPVVVAGFQAGHISRPQANTIGTGTTALAVGSRSLFTQVQQGFITGTTVSAGYNQSYSDSNSLGQSLNPLNQGNLSLSITQRILQGFGKAVNNRNIRIAKNNLKVADLTFKQQVTVTTSNIINLYWDLVSINADYGVKKQSVELASKLFEDNKKQVEIGTLAPIEVIRAEAELARTEQELTVSETQLLQQETIIKNVLSRNGITSETIKNARIIPTDSIRVSAEMPSLNLDELYDQALANRPEIEQTKINIGNTKIGIAGNRSQLLPSLDVSLSLQNNGLAGLLNPNRLPNALPPDAYFLGGRSDVLGQLFRRNFPDYSLSFQLNIPLRNRAARADMIIEEISLRQQEIRQQQQLNQLKVSVQNSITALRQADAGVRTAQKSRVLQEQTLDAEQKKFVLGATTIFFVIQAQRDLAQARSAEVAALGNYAKAKNNLDQSLGLTLERNSVSIDEAKSGTVARDSQIPLEYLQQNRNN